MDINELNCFKLLVLHNYNKRLYVEYVQNDTLVVGKTAYRQLYGQKFNQVGGGSNIDGLS